MTTRVEAERIRRLNDLAPDPAGRYVLYWMQAAQRAQHNPALEVAIQRANDHGTPVVAAIIVVPDSPEATARHVAFMLGGLARTLPALERRGVRACLRVGDPVDLIGELAADAAEVVLDRGYLRHQVEWYDSLVAASDRCLTQVEGEVVVPIDLVSDHAEHAARTIRPKVAAERDRFLVELDPTALDTTTTPHATTSDVELDRLDDRGSVTRLLQEWGVPGEPGTVERPVPGTPAARRALAALVARVGAYDADRTRYTDPDSTSGLSPYLHFGQISPVAVAVAVRERAGPDAEAFLEELIVRRELAINFVARTPDYDTYSALPEWARTSLQEHRDDEREVTYTAAELEAGRTHDEVWNTIMGLVREDGWAHNQLRMYWGKQIVRWTNTPEHAFRTLLELNNRYFLDGCDPSSYANVGWCFGLHDQGFREREVTGKVRPFTTAALERKDDLASLVDRHRAC